VSQTWKRIFEPFKDFRFEIFCRETKQPHNAVIFIFYRLIKKFFDQSLIYCSGIVTGGGFETPG
jgi:hypothetical protein